MQATPNGAHMLQLGLQQYWPVPQVVDPQATPRPSGTHAQTLAELSKWNPGWQVAPALQTQTPPQSAPPWAGSQSSLGSSMHRAPPGQRMPAMPPQNGPLGRHAPWWATLAPAAAAWQALPYVLPSQPHTGSKICRQASGRGVQVPAAAQTPDGCWQ